MMSEEQLSRHATSAAVFAFRAAEHKRLELELAEQRLWLSLRDPHVTISQYAKETDVIMDEFEKKRRDARKRGTLPKE